MSKRIKILVTAIGSMASVAVIEALREEWFTAEIVGTDIYPEKWLAQRWLIDKFFQVPRADDQGYLQKMLEICRENNIDYLIPLIDPEVDILAVNRGVFEKEGTKICISGTESIEKCRDKLTLYQTFNEDGTVSVIPTYIHLETVQKNHGYPLIIKPKKGRSSEGIQILKERDEIGHLAFQTGSCIIQPYYKGEVYTVDIIRDFSGSCVSIPRKELIRNKIGVGLTVEITNNKTLEKLSERIVEKLNIIGAVNIEFLYRNGEYLVMDINPRFSAGVGFSKLAGYDFINNHMKVYREEHIQPLGEFKPMIAAKNYYDVVVKMN